MRLGVVVRWFGLPSLAYESPMRCDAVLVILAAPSGSTLRRCCVVVGSKHEGYRMRRGSAFIACKRSFQCCAPRMVRLTLLHVAMLP